MNFLKVAARVSSAVVCHCGGLMQDFVGSGHMTCQACGYMNALDRTSVAAKKKAPKKKSPKTKKEMPQPIEDEQPSREAPEPSATDLLSANTEFSVRAEVSLSVDFEGSVSQSKLKKKFRNELMAAIKEAVTITANSLQVSPSTVVVQPIMFDVAVNDNIDLQDEIDI